MIFDNKRISHSVAVARKLRQLAYKLTGNEEYSENLFYLGLLHDVAYEFSDTQEEHERRGGEILRRNGYQYWKEVYYHGKPNVPHSSPELFLLNFADMTTGPKGEVMTIDERISEIGHRYGKNSLQYKNSVALAALLRANPLFHKAIQATISD